MQKKGKKLKLKSPWYKNIKYALDAEKNLPEVGMKSLRLAPTQKGKNYVDTRTIKVKILNYYTCTHCAVCTLYMGKIHKKVSC